MKIAYTNAADNAVHVVNGAPKDQIDRLFAEPLTDEQYSALVWKTVPADAINPAEISVDALPVDQSFRDAWRHDGSVISIHMPTARNLLRDQIRIARARLLAALDVEYQRADEGGDTIKKQAIAAKKQQLRDMPAHPGIDAATTPDELKAAWPAGLPT